MLLIHNLIKCIEKKGKKEGNKRARPGYFLDLKSGTECKKTKDIT